MIQEFDVLLGNEKIGRVSLETMGLYYRLSCKCRLSGQVICQLVAYCDSDRINLGTFVPDRGNFCVNTSIPIKKIGSGKLCFRAEPKRMELKSLFVPIRPDEPFAYLSALNHAYLQQRNGEYGAVIKD